MEYKRLELGYDRGPTSNKSRPSLGFDELPSRRGQTRRWNRGRREGTEWESRDIDARGLEIRALSRQDARNFVEALKSWPAKKFRRRVDRSSSTRSSARGGAE